MAKPTFSLPIIMDARTTKKLLDDEVNRYGGLIWDGTIVAASDPTLAQQVRDDVAQSAADAQQSAADAALYDGPRYPDVTAFFAAPDSFTAGTYVRTDADGFAYRPVDTATATTVANAAPQAFEVLEGPDGRVNGKSVGATGNGTTDDAIALNKMLAFPAVLLPRGTYLTESPLVAVDDLISLNGIGWHETRTSGFSSKVMTGSLIEAPSTVADVLTVQSTSPSSGTTTVASNVTLADFGIIHKGTGAAITIDNVIRNQIRDVAVDCDNTGAFGIKLDNWAFFSRMERVLVSNFTDTGILVGGDGTQHYMKDMQVGAGNTANANSAVEMRRQDFHIDGGQYDCNRVDDMGVGILVNNTSDSNKTGGRISNIITESDVSVKITGTTKPFSDVHIYKPFWSMGNVVKGVIFDRASYCILDRPLINNPNDVGTVAEWTENSISCGVIAGFNAARGNYIVDASATRPWMRVIDRVNYNERPDVFTDANLFVTIDDCENVGQTQHNGVAWDKYLSFISDDDVAVFDIPFSGGVIEIVTRNDAEADGSVSFIKVSNATKDLRGGLRLDRNDAALTGTTGVDGNVTVGLSGGQLYVENRTGGNDNFLIRYYGRTTA